MKPMSPKLKQSLVAAILVLGGIVAGAVGGPGAIAILTGSKVVAGAVESLPEAGAPIKGDAPPVAPAGSTLGTTSPGLASEPSAASPEAAPSASSEVVAPAVLESVAPEAKP